MYNCCSTIKSETIYPVNSSAKSLRKKFLMLAFGQVPLGIFLRIPLRISSLFQGDFIAEGYRQSLNERQIKRQAWSLNADSTKAAPKCYPLVIKNVIIECIKRIFKIATYPIAMIGLEGAALYGLVNPSKGRFLYGTIERAWANNRGQIEHENRYRFVAKEYLAVCMQPKTIWDKYNFYHFDPHYHSDTIRSLILRIETLLNEKQIFFKNEGIDTESLVAKLDHYKSLIRHISPNRYSEVVGGVIDMTYNDENNKRSDFRKGLHYILAGLKTLEVNREKMCSSQEKKWKQSRTKIYKERYVNELKRGCEIVHSSVDYLDKIVNSFPEETV